MIFLALLANGESEIRNLPSSDDVKASLEAVKAFGGEVAEEKGRVRIVGGEVRAPEDVINMKGSGTGARIAIGIGTLVPKGFGACITGNESLRRRPMGPVVEVFNALGAEVKSLRGDKLPVVSFGGLPGGEAEVDGSVTSQHVTSALIAGTKSERGVRLKIKNLVSRAYVALTEEVLETFGAEVECSEDYSECSVKPSELRPVSMAVPGDYALAAFPMTLAVITKGRVVVEGLPAPRDGPGDHRIIQYLKAFGAEVAYISEKVEVSMKGRPKAVKLNLRDEPDLALPIAAVAAIAQGESVLRGLSHLAYKESNRLEQIVKVLNCFGVKARVDAGSIRVWGTVALKPCTITCPDDHRIAMMASLLGAYVGARVDNAECVSKSWPEYWEVLKRLGVRLIEY
jgi:3-phosphoshikimate 1-carboxyvinyltransferase